MIQNNKIAIIIVNWKQYELTKSCLSTLKSSKFNDFQIILIDNESNQKELNDLKNQFDQVKTFTSEKNLGFTNLPPQANLVSLENNF